MTVNVFWQTSRRVWLSYFVVYLSAGFIMNGIGQWMEIARFANWWQVISCYGLYLVPASLFVKHRSMFDQYLYGLFFLGLLELGGYTLQTSIPYPNNVIDALFTERNFALAMTLFFAGLLPLGNWTMKHVLQRTVPGSIEQGEASLNTCIGLRKSV